MMPGILIFYYIGGGGGKFIANLLTYTGSVAISDYDTAVRNNPAEYNTTLLNTIPERSNSREWMQREHGCAQLFGPGVADIKSGAPVTGTLNDLTVLPVRWVPIMAHTLAQVHNIQEFFGTAAQKLVIVDAIPEFVDLAIRLKWPDTSHCLDLAQYKQFQADAATVRADYTFDAWDPRLANAPDRIQQFAATLGLTLDLTPAQDYIEKYQAFHC